MTTYALIHAERGDTGRRQDFEMAPPGLAPEKGLRWLPLVREPDPAFDPATQRLSAPETTVGPDAVTVSCQVVEMTEMEKRLRMRAARAEAYRARLGKLPTNTDRETMGDVHDETLGFFAANAALLQSLGFAIPEGLQRVLNERAAIKQEIPPPAGVTSSGRKKV